MMFRNLSNWPHARRTITSGARHASLIERDHLESGLRSGALTASEGIHSDPAILVQHLDAAYNLARYLMRNETEAEDVVHSAYLRAISHFAGYRGGDGRAWLLKIVRNCCYDRMRASAPSAQHTSFDEGVHSGARQIPDPEATLLRAERGEWVRKSLAKLPPDSREVLVLRELEQLSYREIAEITACPLGTITSRLSRARQRMKRALFGCLEGEDVDPDFVPASGPDGLSRTQSHDRS